MVVSVVRWAALMIPLCFASARASNCVSSALDAIGSGSPQEALPALRSGARRGDERCDFILGIWAISGTGMKPDTVAGSRWLKRAAREGLPTAQSHLGLLYASGLGVQKDVEKAAHWYRAAADSGDTLGQAALGAATFYGVGVPTSRIGGYAWMSLAAARGDEKARTALSIMEEAMSAEEIQHAREKAGKFEPRQQAKRPRLDRRDALRAFGLHWEPTEYERMFGY